ncbi:MAG TPA: universal stress protein [Bryobacteraceae bacterium]|nr:universal stress protein [Bryobacteraceae bacterium]
MLSFKTILFPVDFSDRCKGAAHFVQAIASGSGSKVILLNVLETATAYPGDLDFGALSTSTYAEDRAATAEEHLQNFVVEELSGLEVERRVELGDPAGTIVRVAQDEHVDLIMMPTHGYGGFRRFILGSVTAKVLHDAQCPVWTGAHLNDASGPVEPIKSVVCALDLTESSDAPFAAAIELAAKHGAKLTITHAVPGTDAIPEKLMDMEFRQHLITEAKRRIDAMLAPAAVQAGVCIESGDVHKVVTSCAKSHKADLVVIGRARHSGFGRLRTHSYAIIRESPCPVISL